MIVYLPLIGGLDRIEPRKHCAHNTASLKEENFKPEVVMIKITNGRDILRATMEALLLDSWIGLTAAAWPIKMLSMLPD